jgi:cell division protease FtsH
VTIGLPTMREREDILKVHVRNKPVAEDVDLRRLAEATPMFSGADLENLTNEAALIAARTNQQVITWNDFNEALDRITLGLRRGSLVPTEEERKILAFHEAGHAVTFAAQPDLGEIRKVTISPRGGAGGFMAPLAKEEMFFSRERFQAQLIVAFGGRVAEKRVTGTLSSGASSDLKQATEMAKQMVLDLGMGGTEYVAWGSDQGPVFLGGEISRRKDFSEETARQLEEKVEGILRDAYERAEAMIEEHWHAVEAVATSLLKVETIDGKLVGAPTRWPRPARPPRRSPTSSPRRWPSTSASCRRGREAARKSEEAQRREEAQNRPPSPARRSRARGRGPRRLSRPRRPGRAPARRQVRDP